MVYDRLAADKPLMITRPVDPAAVIDMHGYLSACEWLDAGAAASIVDQADRLLGDDEAVTRLEHWVSHYFGDTSPGAATARFHGAVQRLMEQWEDWYARTPQEEDEDEDESDEAPLNEADI